MDPSRDRGTGYPSRRRSSHHGFTPMNNYPEPNQVSPYRMTHPSHAPDWVPGQSLDPDRITYELDERVVNLRNHQNRNPGIQSDRHPGLPHYSNDYRSYFVEPPRLDRNPGYAGHGQNAQNIDITGDNRRREQEFQRDTYGGFAQQNPRYDDRRYTLQNRISLDDGASGYGNVVTQASQGYNPIQERYDGYGRPPGTPISNMECRVGPQNSVPAESEMPRNPFQAPAPQTNRSYRPGNLTGQDIPTMPKKDNEHEFNWAYQNYVPKAHRYEIDLDFKPKIFRIPSGLSCLALHKAKKAENQARSAGGPSPAPSSVRPSTVGHAVTRESRTDYDRRHGRLESELHRTTNMYPIPSARQNEQNRSRRGTNSVTFGQGQGTNQNSDRHDTQSVTFGHGHDCNSIVFGQGTKVLPFGRLTHSFDYGLEATLNAVRPQTLQTPVEPPANRYLFNCDTNRNLVGRDTNQSLVGSPVNRYLRGYGTSPAVPGRDRNTTPSLVEPLANKDVVRREPQEVQPKPIEIASEDKPKTLDVQVHQVETKVERVSSDLSKEEDSSEESDEDEGRRSYVEQLRRSGVHFNPYTLQIRSSPWFINVEESEEDLPAQVKKEERENLAPIQEESLDRMDKSIGNLDADNSSEMFIDAEEPEDLPAQVEKDDPENLAPIQEESLDRMDKSLENLDAVDSSDSEFDLCVASYAEELLKQISVNDSPKLSSSGPPGETSLQEKPVEIALEDKPKTLDVQVHPVETKVERVSSDLSKEEDSSEESDEDEGRRSYSEELRKQISMNDSSKLSSTGPPGETSLQPKPVEIASEDKPRTLDVQVHEVETKVERVSSDLSKEENSSEESDEDECRQSYVEQLRRSGVHFNPYTLQIRSSPWFMNVEESEEDLPAQVKKEETENMAPIQEELLDRKDKIVEILEADNSSEDLPAQVNEELENLAPIQKESLDKMDKSMEILDADNSSEDLPAQVNEEHENLAPIQKESIDKMDKSVEILDADNSSEDLPAQVNEEPENLAKTHEQFLDRMDKSIEILDGDNSSGMFYNVEEPEEDSPAQVKKELENLAIQEKSLDRMDKSIDNLDPDNSTDSEFDQCVRSYAEELRKQISVNDSSKLSSSGSPWFTAVDEDEKPTKMSAAMEPVKVQKPRRNKKALIPPAPRPTGYLGQRQLQRQRALILKNQNAEETNSKPPNPNATKGEAQSQITSKSRPSGAPGTSKDQKKSKAGYGKPGSQPGPN